MGLNCAFLVIAVFGALTLASPLDNVNNNDLNDNDESNQTHGLTGQKLSAAQIPYETIEVSWSLQKIMARPFPIDCYQPQQIGHCKPGYQAIGDMCCHFDEL